MKNENLQVGASLDEQDIENLEFLHSFLVNSFTGATIAGKPVNNLIFSLKKVLKNQCELKDFQKATGFQTAKEAGNAINQVITMLNDLRETQGLERMYE